MSLRRLLVPGALLACGAVLAACGEDDFENQPRPAATIELGARVSEGRVEVSPSKASAVGAGLANFTVSNQSDQPVSLTLDGPTEAVGDPIPPGGVGDLKAELAQGKYEVGAGEESDALADTLRVGAPRPSSQNDLLLP
jgi:hypothetical protein